MLELTGKYLMVFGLGMLKFAFAPVVAVGLGLSFWDTFIFTVAGMMTTVIVLAFIGERLRPWLLRVFFPNRRIFTSRNRRIVKIWRKYGVVGVAFLTPILFSPVVGMMIALAFGEKRLRIIVTMGVSALFWGVVLSLMISFYGVKIMNYFAI